MSHGAFCWYELSTTDAKAARTFYADVIGWGSEDMPGMDYTILKSGDARVAGLMTLPEPVRERGVPPHWIGYIAVDDVDLYTARAQAGGATLRHGPADIPGVGRFAILTDPQGAPISLFKGDGEAPPPSQAPGHACWRELHTSDPEAAFGFYAGLFGWTKGETLAMGPAGAYQLFTDSAGLGGGVMRAGLGVYPAWLIYFGVDALDRAAQRAELAGGMIIQGATEVPGGMWVAQLRDPQGAAFAIASQTR